jgi:hypothetical protein
MAIDASIALGVKPIQLESPINQMSNVYALQNAAQSNQLNQMKMDEYKRGVAQSERVRNYLATAKPDDPAFVNNLAALDPELAMKYQTHTANLAESQAKTKKLGFESQDAQSKLLKSKLDQSKETLINNVRTPEGFIAWHEANHKDSVIGPYLANMGVTQETARASIDQELAKPGGLQELIRKSSIGLDKFIESQKPREVAPGNVVLGPDNKVIYTAPYKPEPSSDIPKLKPGEVWDAKKQTVMQVPGSAEYNKQSKVHGTDYNATKTVISKMDNAISKVNEILDPKNTSGFEGNFGGYNAAITRQFTGNTAKVKKAIESVKSDMKSAGLELVRAGGSIGALTEREWPMLEAQINAIDYTLDEDDARAAFSKVISTFNRIKAQAKDTYQTTWSETQYFKPDAIKDAGTAPAASAAKTKDQLDYEAFINAQSGAKKR